MCVLAVTTCLIFTDVMHCTLFSSEKPVPQRTFPMQGILINTNTVEAFRTYNKMELIQSIGQQVTCDNKADKCAIVAIYHP